MVDCVIISHTRLVTGVIISVVFALIGAMLGIASVMLESDALFVVMCIVVLFTLCGLCLLVSSVKCYIEDPPERIRRIMIFIQRIRLPCTECDHGDDGYAPLPLEPGSSDEDLPPGCDDMAAVKVHDEDEPQDVEVTDDNQSVHSDHSSQPDVRPSDLSSKDKPEDPKEVIPVSILPPCHEMPSEASSSVPEIPIDLNKRETMIPISEDKPKDPKMNIPSGLSLPVVPKVDNREASKDVNKNGRISSPVVSEVHQDVNKESLQTVSGTAVSNGVLQRHAQDIEFQRKAADITSKALE